MHPLIHRRDFLESLVVLLSAPRLRAQPPSATDLARSIADAANTLAALLRPELRRQLEFPFEDPERKDWSNVPHFAHPRKGVRFGDLSPQERAAAHQLLQTILSSQGYEKALSIMERDEFLGEHSRPGQAAGAGFGWEFYFLDVFGKVGGDQPWGVQLDGHHCAVNVTVIDHAVTVTPTSLGAEPALIPSGPHAGWRVLGGESAKGFALLKALTPDQARQAVLSETVPTTSSPGPAAMTR